MGQVHHGSATTTAAIRRAIQHSQDSLRQLAARYGINPKTIAKWKKRTSTKSLFERLILCWIIECGEGHQTGDEGDAAGCDVEATGPFTQQPAPAAEPAQGPLDHPAPLEHDEALLIRLLLHHLAAHAVQGAPLLAAMGPEHAVEDRQAQARPLLLAGIQRRQRVAILHVGGHDGHGQDEALGVHHQHALASDKLLGPVVAARPAHPDTLDALGIDDRQAGLRATTAATPLAAGQGPHQDREHALLDPPPEPAVDRAPGRKPRRQ
jgi:hypothetical protein